MILVHSTRNVGDHLRERKDLIFFTIVENQDIWLRNALVEDLVASIANLWTMKYWISLE
jgi:hypothetical protein